QQPRSPYCTSEVSWPVCLYLSAMTLSWRLRVEVPRPTLLSALPSTKATVTWQIAALFSLRICLAIERGGPNALVPGNCSRASARPTGLISQRAQRDYCFFRGLRRFEADLFLSRLRRSGNGDLVGL